MKLGVLTFLFGEKPLEQTLDLVRSLGLDAVEFGTGGYLKTGHFQTEELLNNASELKQLKKAIADRNLSISALSCHGNPLHPNPKIAQAHHRDFVQSCQLAQKLEVDQVNSLSGCPGSDSSAKLPSWITCPFPPEDFGEALEWQWQEKVIPYWKQAIKVAGDHGVKVGIEMVPNCAVYNVETLLKLRESVGETLGANLDPSHLFWQGADISCAIRKLGQAIYHFHAKDSSVNGPVVAANGVLDGKDLNDHINRSWSFRIVGEGHDQLTWSDIINELQRVGYDSVLSIELEGSFISAEDGLRRAVDFLRRVKATMPAESGGKDRKAGSGSCA